MLVLKESFVMIRLCCKLKILTMKSMMKVPLRNNLGLLMLNTPLDKQGSRFFNINNVYGLMSKFFAPNLMSIQLRILYVY